jgi:proteasome lid subunit RPN8/RPN11
MVLKIKKQDVELIIQNSKESAPAEACGILIGEKVGKEKIVKKVITAKNTLGSSTAYQMDAEEVMRAFKSAEDAGLQVIGFFHSHPFHEPFWSAEDDEKSEYWPGHSFLIFSLKTGNIRCYNKVREDRVEEEQVVVG